MSIYNPIYTCILMTHTYDVTTLVIWLGLYETCTYLKGVTTIISGNNVRKCLLESDFLASCSGITLLKLLNVRQVAGKYGASHYNCN